MTIDEAIKHAIQVADSYKDTAPDCDCARDHRQLAEWLKKARIYEKCKKLSVSMIRKLKEENAKLRRERDHWHVEQVHAYSNWEDAHNRASELEAENAKLRELAREAD